MTNQTNISTAISPDYKRFGSPLYDLALANDLLAGYVLAGCPDYMTESLIIVFPEVSAHLLDLAEFGGIEDLWIELSCAIIRDEAPSEDYWGTDRWEAYCETDLDIFTARINALSEILNHEIEEAA